ncbi:MAG TPA: KTSC domain-containing protein [Ureibacillus sp.]|nr:KTSC domain-containing protein [Ureibacillus sp.]
MQMTYVSSSNLEAVGYDSTTQTLRIRFHSGTYDYFNVPLHVYQGLMNAGSKGSYHAAFIKNAYQYRQV